MDSAFILRGLLLGISIAAPVGPIGVLCIRRTLASGRLHGFISGLGAATADTIYGGIAAGGLTALSGILIGYSSWMRLFGGAFLCYLGIKTFLSPPTLSTASARTSGALVAYTSTLLLTLANPATILSFAAIFVGVGASSTLNSADMVLGVFLGSALWWLLLSVATSMLRERLNLVGMRIINRGSGCIICGFGVLALVSLFVS